MPTPDLIMQQRELARTVKTSVHQLEQSLAAADAQKREIAVLEQQHQETDGKLDAWLAEYVEMELIARAKICGLHADAFKKVAGAPMTGPIANPEQTLTECRAEVEQIVSGLKMVPVRLRFVAVPSDVDKAEVVKKLNSITPNVKWLTVPTRGEFRKLDIVQAREIVSAMDSLGIKAEITM